MSRKHTNADVLAAVRWFHRFRGPSFIPLSPDESADWKRWSADDTHLDAFCQAKALWLKLETLSPGARPSREDLAADDYDPSQSVSDWLTRRRAKKPLRYDA